MPAKISLLLFVMVLLCSGDEFDEEQYGVKYANDCEVCKIVTLELDKALEKSGKSHQVQSYL